MMWRRVRLSYSTLVDTTAVAMVRSTQAGTFTFNSTVYVKTVRRPLCTTSRISSVMPPSSENDTRTLPSRTSGLTRTESAQAGVAASATSRHGTATSRFPSIRTDLTIPRFTKIPMKL